MPSTSDGLASYNLAIAAQREIGVRAGLYEPSSDIERRWLTEGPVATDRLEVLDLGENGRWIIGGS